MQGGRRISEREIEQICETVALFPLYRWVSLRQRSVNIWVGTPQQGCSQMRFDTLGTPCGQIDNLYLAIRRQ